jgi:glutathione S-transferase
MPSPYRHYAWPVSPYSAKTRAYLRFKAVPFEEVVPSARMLYGPIKKAVGRMVMPTLQTPDGEWMQDTSEIIDRLESTLPGPSITPPGPTQRVANLLLELLGDEWLPMVALHYRWNRPANAAFAIDEFARYGAPLLPRFLARPIVRPIAKKMAGYLPMPGVTADTIPGLESFSTTLIARLDAHLAEHPFLFGGRPALADFALYGPLWAHLFRDPASRELFDERPHVRAWFERLQAPPVDGDFLADDEVPKALDPIFATLFEEQFPFILRLADAIDAYCEEHPDATRVPRSLGPAPFTVGGVTGSRKLITFSWWMAQRALDAHSSQPATAEWLARVHAGDALERPVNHRLERRGFRMGLRRDPPS